MINRYVSELLLHLKSCGMFASNSWES